MEDVGSKRPLRQRGSSGTGLGGDSGNSDREQSQTAIASAVAGAMESRTSLDANRDGEVSAREYGFSQL